MTGQRLDERDGLVPAGGTARAAPLFLDEGDGLIHSHFKMANGSTFAARRAGR